MVDLNLLYMRSTVKREGIFAVLYIAVNQFRLLGEGG
jgi:hypothetical protein